MDCVPRGYKHEPGMDCVPRRGYEYEPGMDCVAKEKGKGVGAELPMGYNYESGMHCAAKEKGKGYESGMDCVPRSYTYESVQPPLVYGVLVPTNNTPQLQLYCVASAEKNSERLLYCDQGISRNFDLTMEDYKVHLVPGRWPMPPSVSPHPNPNDPKFVELSHLAIQLFNRYSEIKYEFLKNVKVNFSMTGGLTCYITFEAITPNYANAPLTTFQALAWSGFGGDRDVHFCRVKPPNI